MTLEEQLREREEENERLRRELEDTDRGVLALYAELDDRATLLRNVNEIKDQFLSHLSHEFRTPLSAIASLATLLLEHSEASLNEEQRTQAYYIRRSADELLEMVNDLLDLAKIQAGKLDVRDEDVVVQELFGGLRGVLRPIVAAGVDLVFDNPIDIPVLRTDGTKLTQILRNLISNALKFTPSGAVRVRCINQDPEHVLFSVQDTGIGIAPDQQERIFQEFTQVDSPLQRNRSGTGLGLALSRRLAGLIGGTLSVHSKEGEGSTFMLLLPVSR